MAVTYCPFATAPLEFRLLHPTVACCIIVYVMASVPRAEVLHLLSGALSQRNENSYNMVFFVLVAERLVFSGCCVFHDTFGVV